jgi:hypothetical protein
LEQLPRVEARSLLGCGHQYCAACFTGYFDNKIKEAAVSELKCPNPTCAVIASTFELEAILSDASYDKYLHFLALAGLKSDQTTCWCPNAQCREPVLADPQRDRVECPACSTTFCKSCQVTPWHASETCRQARARQAVDDSLFVWMGEKGARVKPCPGCHEGIEKNEGCNHITCAGCKHQWCWLCSATYTASHFSSGGCSGLQFAKGDTLEEALGFQNPPSAAASSRRLPTPIDRTGIFLNRGEIVDDAELRAPRASLTRPPVFAGTPPVVGMRRRRMRDLLRNESRALILTFLTVGLAAPLYIRYRRARRVAEEEDRLRLASELDQSRS